MQKRESFIFEHEPQQFKQYLTTTSDAAFQKCLLQLKRRSNVLNYSAYEHISDLIQAILDDRPDNVLEYFDEFSRKLRRDKYNEIRGTVTLRTEDKTDANLQVAKNVLATFDSICHEETQRETSMAPEQRSTVSCTIAETSTEMETKASGKIPDKKMNKGNKKTTDETNKKDKEDRANDNTFDVCRDEPELRILSLDILLLHHYWSLLGIGFPPTKTFLLSCALQKLKLNPSIESVRFWGKIFGTKKNYYIVEVQLVHSELLRRLASLETHSPCKEAHPPNMDDLKCPLEYPTIPQVRRESFKDKYCHDLNRSVYFVKNSIVTNEFNDDWIELPAVSQHQIRASRDIFKYFTGELDAHVSASPLFPGREENYLRAMIARISASTQIAPRGAYKMSSTILSNHATQDLREEIENPPMTIIIPCRDVNFKPMRTDQLMETKSWVHLQPFIFEHGDTRPLIDENTTLQSECVDDKEQKKATDATAAKLKDNAKVAKGKSDQKAADKKAAAAADTRSDKLDDSNTFKSCSDDACKNHSSVWSMLKPAVMIDSMKNIVLVKSNIWHGAFAFASGAISDNIYLGWGIKNRINYCVDSSTPFFQKESQDNLDEICDPTPVHEQIIEIAADIVIPTTGIENAHDVPKSEPVVGKTSKKIPNQ